MIDTDISPKGAVTAFLLHSGSRQSLRFWDFVGNRIVGSISIPDSDKVTAITWHPRGEMLYAIQHKGKEWQIIRTAADAKEWHPIVVYQAMVPLRRLVFSTQRFAASYLSKRPNSEEFRVYFGAMAKGGKWEVRTVRESGDSPYTLAGPAPAPMPTAPVEGDVPPDSKGNQFTLPSALPASFFRSGEMLLIENEKNCFSEFRFGVDDWNDSHRTIQWKSQPLCGGSLTYTPNGMGVIACEGTSSLKCKGYRSKTREGSAALEEVRDDPTLDTPSTCVPNKEPPRPFKLGQFGVLVGDTAKVASSNVVDLRVEGNGKSYGMQNLPLRRIASYRMEDGTEALFMLLELYSDLDRMVGLRPHVYRLAQDGIRPLWRGSGLAFPLIDAIPVKVGNRDVLCALHSGGSFLSGVQNVQPPFVMVYQWNGFGFSAERDKTVLPQCQAIFRSSILQYPTGTHYTE